jgi:hypothetical protein
MIKYEVAVFKRSSLKHNLKATPQIQCLESDDYTSHLTDLPLPQTSPAGYRQWKINAPIVQPQSCGHSRR